MAKVARDARRRPYSSLVVSQMPEPRLRILSLGAGVQSSTVLLMSLYGDLPPLDFAIFADTGWEPRAVYEHLDRLEAEAKEAGTPIHRVTAGNIREDHIRPTGQHLFVRNPKKRPENLGTLRVSIPLYTATSIGPTFGAKKGRTQRRCTSTYKVEPVEKEMRRLLGLQPRQRWPLGPVIDQIFGISYDETVRMRDSRRPAIVNHYPLVDARMTRDDCHKWLADHGWSAPRSACIGCPFHRNDEWRRLRDDSPEEFDEAVEFDHEIRAAQAAGKLSFDGIPYIHDQRVPLDEAELDEDDGGQMSLFGEECEGLCGI